MIQLAYCSRPATALTLRDAETILATARQKNGEADITGLLVFRHDLFLQVLEGPRAAVTQTFARILRDTRHDDVQLLGCRNAEERAFGGWKMGFVAASEENGSFFEQIATALRGDCDLETLLRATQGLRYAELSPEPSAS